MQLKFFLEKPKYYDFTCMNSYFTLFVPVIYTLSNLINLSEPHNGIPALP
jgi:hypothetical protein